MSRFLVIGYAVMCYVMFVAAFIYAIGFVGDFGVPRSVDSAAVAPAGQAVAIDMVLLSVFAIQHSVMARPAFKRWWTHYVAPPIERSTYVLVTNLVLFLLFWQWRSIPAVVWNVTAPAGRLGLWVLFWLGWLMALASTFMISHFDLFGLRQAYLAGRGKPHANIGFRSRLLYRLVRHPIMLGFVIAFWATPKLTAGHLLFAVATTGYIVIAVQLEEHDLVAGLGDEYRDYRRRVPMLLPWPRKHLGSGTPEHGSRAL
ncbi:methanethiol S-methyltransferase [Mycobacterium botniense]|uniref:methanethiol S-methyltransferase n=1 Tax=Mycobacterium botniense TaxID=84962 RepID=A0A7I9XZ80_9MYCO|nr:methanethiol S-methyltransferase [Mycobacterium botniense]GFG75023.1 membrane protein [Mycobacterium botniense]